VIPSVSGLLLVNKPSGPTSYDMIRRLKRLFPGVKIGHCGTLDPMAAGLLLILLGRATKKQADLMKCDKTYLCRMRFGVKTDTADITGQVIETAPQPLLSADDFSVLLASFQGEQLQLPPMYSALKHQGQPLYKLARQGKDIERERRRITIHEIQSTQPPTAGEAEIRVRCSSGTYVRTLVEDIAARANSCATLSALIRETVGPYQWQEAISGNDLSAEKLPQIMSKVLPI
jgi:tRNA pseudouridine55 synthase